MSKIFIVLWMVFFHIVDDYYLQGWLASAKQKSWWEKNSPDPLYKHDYICALIMHAFSWTFMIMLPIAYCMDFTITPAYIMMFAGNWVVHSVVDDLKANKHMTNLFTDQMNHICQIVMTAWVLL